MMKNNKGFTLVELLATIVIIALVATIATVSITGVIGKTKKDTATVSYAATQKALETYIIQNKQELINNGIHNCPNDVKKKCTKITEETLKDDGYINGKVGEENVVYSWEIPYDSDTMLFEIPTTDEITKGGYVVTTGSLANDIKKDNSVKTIDDDDGTSYYYSGYNANNLVKIGDYEFRIIRINGDGTIRLLFNKDYTHTDGTLMKVGSGSSRIADLDSYASEFLNLTINSNGNTINDIVKDSDYCISEYSSVPSNVSNLKCSTSNTKNQKIGFISMDEAVLSGATSSSSTSDTYINNCLGGSRCKRIYFYAIHSTKPSSSFGFGVRTSDDKIDEVNVTKSNFAGGIIRPVINISGYAPSKGGDGTSKTPYEINVDSLLGGN